MAEKLITLREASEILGISEKELIDLAAKKKIPHYFVGGEFLRFKKEEILKAKPLIQKEFKTPEKGDFKEKVYNFFYFNDFYIVSFVLICFLLFIIFSG